MPSSVKLNQDPFAQFLKWFKEAQDSEVLPEAFALATANKLGKPSVRMLLFKGLDEKGFRFFTNYESPKADELTENDEAAIVFYWPNLQRQLRIEGWVEKLSRQESEEYFATRDRGSQIGAWASPQSQTIHSRDLLENRFRTFKKKFAGQDIPCPPSWGGYRLRPERFEFWISGKHRLHDRFSYLKVGKGWKRSRLAP